MLAVGSMQGAHELALKPILMYNKGGRRQTGWHHLFQASARISSTVIMSGPEGPRIEDVSDKKE
jgi:hypothetical protein